MRRYVSLLDAFFGGDGLFLKQIFFGVVLRIDRRSHHNLLEAKRKTMSDGTLSNVLACLREVLLMKKSCTTRGCKKPW